MKLKKIIKYLNALDNCILSIIDPKTGKEIDSWEGSILNIPWVFMEYYLYNDSGDYEAICVTYKDNKAFLDISLYDNEVPSIKKEMWF